MKLYSNQLAGQLQKKLLPVYLLVGDEPLQLQEAGDAIKKALHGRPLEPGLIAVDILRFKVFV